MYYRDKQRKKETDKLRQVKNSAEFVKGLNEMSEKLRDKIEPNILISTITAESSPDAFKTLKTMFDSSNKAISNMRWHIAHSDDRSTYMSNVIAVPAQMRTNMVDEHKNHIWKDRHLQLSLGQSNLADLREIISPEQKQLFANAKREYGYTDNAMTIIPEIDEDNNLSFSVQVDLDQYAKVQSYVLEHDVNIDPHRRKDSFRVSFISDLSDFTHDDIDSETIYAPVFRPDTISRALGEFMIDRSTQKNRITPDDIKSAGEQYYNDLKNAFDKSKNIRELPNHPGIYVIKADSTSEANQQLLDMSRNLSKERRENVREKELNRGFVDDDDRIHVEMNDVLNRMTFPLHVISDSRTTGHYSQHANLHGLIDQFVGSSDKKSNRYIITMDTSTEGQYSLEKLKGRLGLSTPNEKSEPYIYQDVDLLSDKIRCARVLAKQELNGLTFKSEYADVCRQYPVYKNREMYVSEIIPKVFDNSHYQNNDYAYSAKNARSGKSPDLTNLFGEQTFKVTVHKAGLEFLRDDINHAFQRNVKSKEDKIMSSRYEFPSNMGVDLNHKKRYLEDFDDLDSLQLEFEPNNVTKINLMEDHAEATARYGVYNADYYAFLGDREFLSDPTFGKKQEKQIQDKADAFVKIHNPGTLIRGLMVDTMLHDSVAKMDDNGKVKEIKFKAMNDLNDDLNVAMDMYVGRTCGIHGDEHGRYWEVVDPFLTNDPNAKITANELFDFTLDENARKNLPDYEKNDKAACVTFTDNGKPLATYTPQQMFSQYLRDEYVPKHPEEAHGIKTYALFQDIPYEIYAGNSPKDNMYSLVAAVHTDLKHSSESRKFTPESYKELGLHLTKENIDQVESILAEHKDLGKFGMRDHFVGMIPTDDPVKSYAVERLAGVDFGMDLNREQERKAEREIAKEKRQEYNSVSPEEHAERAKSAARDRLMAARDRHDEILKEKEEADKGKNDPNALPSDVIS